MALTSAWFYISGEIVQISIRQNQSVVNAFLPIMFLASGQARCPIAFSCFPPAIGRGVRLTACKDIQNLPNCQKIREIFAITLEFYCHPCLFSPSCQASLYCQDLPVQLAREFSPDICDIREIVMIKKTPSVTCHMEIFDFFLPHTSPLLL